ncbi:uncharacterized protein LOC133175231 [Saccostrea echinata]|uniref:uncharacterized protein LOC133175231 n=1 Tax=Saccostrea echinata TaxID=191078 RepID=UPI002A821A5D|nr:uncharacterized protein LOC133175231 [Saccostrea echinata]
MLQNTSRTIIRRMMVSPSSHLMQNSVRNRVNLLSNFSVFNSTRHYSDKSTDDIKKNRVLSLKDKKLQLHFHIVNDPSLTPREKHLMISALIANVKFCDEEFGKLIYADPYGKEVLQFMKTRKQIPMFGIPASCVMAYFLPYSIYAQVALAGVLSAFCVSDFYRVMSGMKKRIFFIYYEPQQKIYTAMTLAGLQDFMPTHFSEEEFQPNREEGPHKVLLHGKTFSAYEGRDAYLNDSYYEILWKEKTVEKNVKNEDNSETQQKMSAIN